MFSVKGTLYDQQRRLEYHTPVVYSCSILPDDRLVMYDLQCVYLHSFLKIKGFNISPSRVGAESPTGNGRSFRLLFAQALTCGSVSHSTNLPKVSTLDSLVITKPREATSSYFIFGHVRRRGYARHLMKRGACALTPLPKDCS
jgi:hypothetical protein